METTFFHCHVENTRGYLTLIPLVNVPNATCEAACRRHGRLLHHAAPACLGKQEATEVTLNR